MIQTLLGVCVALVMTGCADDGDGSPSSTSPEPAGSSASLPEPSSTVLTPSTTSSSPASAPAIDAAALTGLIAYSAAMDDATSADVYVLDVASQVTRRLTDGSEDEFDPALSPDGRRIAYRRNPRPDSDAADIWVMNVDGSGKRNLTLSAERNNWAPAWTSDGRIVYSRSGSDGVLELWSMTRDGSQQRRLAEGWCEYASPSPDAASYACAAPAGGAYDIVVVDAQGGRRSLTTTPESEFGASWSPDGEWIVFSRDLGDRWELLRIRPDGTDEQVVAEEGVFATWDPQSHLVWSGPGGINVAEADGSARTVIDVPADFISWQAGATG
jgi:Tol biopolymer transport system component